MGLTVTCTCGQKYQVDETLSGKRVRCKKCGGAFEVPELIAPLDDEPATVVPMPPSPLGGSPSGLRRQLPAGPMAPIAPPHQASVFVEPVRRTRRKSKSQVGLLVVGLVLLSAAGITIAGSLIYVLRPGAGPSSHGHRPEDFLTPEEMAASSGQPVVEPVQLEPAAPNSFSFGYSAIVPPTGWTYMKIETAEPGGQTVILHQWTHIQPTVASSLGFIILHPAPGEVLGPLTPKLSAPLFVQSALQSAQIQDCVTDTGQDMELNGMKAHMIRFKGKNGLGVPQNGFAILWVDRFQVVAGLALTNAQQGDPDYTAMEAAATGAKQVGS